MKKTIIIISLLFIFTFAACERAVAEITVGTAANTADITTAVTTATADDKTAENVTPANAETAAENIDIDITFTQTADTTVISITSPVVSQFVSEMEKDKSIENSFNLTFLPSKENGGFSAGYTMEFAFLGDFQNAIFSDLSAQKSYYSGNGQYPDLLFTLEGDTAVWSLNNADMKLDKIETVEVFAHIGEDNPNTAMLMLSTILPISEITVGSELPLPDESKLPYSITGVYNTGSHNSTLGEELLFVSAVPGGYSVTYGDYISPAMQANVNSGGGISLERGTDGEIVSFFSGNDPNFQSGMLYVKDKSGNEIYHFDGRKAQIRPGSYSYLDAATGAPKEYIKMEIENGLFKFTIANEYTTEWLSPKTVTESQIIFDVTKYVGNQVVTEIILRNTHNRLFPQAGLFIEFAEYSPLRGGLLFGDVDKAASEKYYGTYKTAEGKAEHTVEIDENGVTIDGQFTVSCSLAELFYGIDWKKLYVNGSSLSSPIFSWQFDGARQSIRIYDTYLTGDGTYFDAYLQYLNTTTTTETTVETIAETTTSAENVEEQEFSICGEYRSVLYSPYIETDEMIEDIINSGENHMLYDYVNITMLDDGSFQAAFMSEWIGRYDDYAFFSSEALGTSVWMSYDSITGESFSLGEVTVTTDGNTAWVTFEGEEAREYTKTK